MVGFECGNQLRVPTRTREPISVEIHFSNEKNEFGMARAVVLVFDRQVQRCTTSPAPNFCQRAPGVLLM